MLKKTLFAMFFLFFLTAIANATIINGSFEQDFLGWETRHDSTGMFIDESVFHSGSKSLKMALGGTSSIGGNYDHLWGFLYQDISMSLSTETTITSNLMLLMPTAGSTTNKWFTMYMEALDASGDRLTINSSYVFGPDSDWNQVSVSIVAPVETDSIRIVAHTGNGNGNGTSSFLWIDDFSLSPDLTPVPEPATMILFGIGLLGLAGISRGKSRV